MTDMWMFPATPLEPDDVMFTLLRQERVLVEGKDDGFAADGDVSEPIDLGEMAVTIPAGEERDISLTARGADHRGPSHEHGHREPVAVWRCPLAGPR